jgi:hypothetical protein
MKRLQFRLQGGKLCLGHSAELHFEGHASAEGTDVFNANLASSRALLVQYFMWRWGADDENNFFSESSRGEVRADPTPEWRYVEIRVVNHGTSRQLRHVPNPNFPSEVPR